MSERRFFDGWQSVRDALEHAYAELGLQMIQSAPSMWEYPAEHWNIAGLVRDYVMRHQGACLQCRAPLDFHTVIRCLDCRALLCEACAPKHFGPTHAQRAASAHQGSSR